MPPLLTVTSSLAGQAEEVDEPECRPKPPEQRAQRAGGLRQPQRPLSERQPPGQVALRASRCKRAACPGCSWKQVPSQHSIIFFFFLQHTAIFTAKFSGVLNAFPYSK